MPEQVEAKSDSVTMLQFKILRFLHSQTATNQSKSTEEFCYMCSRGTMSTSSDTHLVEEKRKEISFNLDTLFKNLTEMNNIDHMRISGIEPS